MSNKINVNLKVIASGEEINKAIASELEQSDDDEKNLAKLREIINDDNFWKDDEPDQSNT